MSRKKQTGTPVSTFAARRRHDLDREVERMLSARAVDEANAEVFDDLIESWRVQEQAGIEANARSVSNSWVLERQQVGAHLDALDEQTGEARRQADAVRAELQRAQMHLRGTS